MRLLKRIVGILRTIVETLLVILFTPVWLYLIWGRWMDRRKWEREETRTTGVEDA